MGVIPHNPAALDLLTQGTLALAKVEAAGMAVDVPYLYAAIRKIGKKTAALAVKLEEGDIGKEWRKAYGPKLNYDSYAQLADVLFTRMGYEPIAMTAGGKNAKARPKADLDALSYIDDPWVRDFVRMHKLDNAATTWLQGILRETVDGRVHPNFNLNLARTYRPSTDKPNLANVPIRDPEIMPLVRRSFIASPGRQLVEVDFKQAEVIAGIAYHNDPSMVAYVTDPDKDMHRDAAAELFLLPSKGMPKALRHEAKSNFVFAQFYGSYYVECARNLWKFVLNGWGKTADGLPLRDHLAAKGVTTLPQFEAVVKRAEDRLWQKRFPAYAQWKYDWYAAYRKTGWFQMLTGFVCQGWMSQNDVCNYPIQGSAFHCLLWVLIRLVQQELVKRGMKTVIVNQVYDSILADAVPAEVPEYVAVCRHVIHKLLPQAMPWLVVPITAEVEICPVGGSWADKGEYKE
jgi:DNA polymerase I-like protein with 3'-5' exonuclease and polymerase domains